MSTSIEKLAQLFKERNNPYIINATTGKVISASPLKIQWGQNIIIEEENLLVANILKTGFTVTYTDTTIEASTDRSLTIKNPLEVGDEVILLPDTDFKKFYVIDKVG
jgi:hypothetical protein